MHRHRQSSVFSSNYSEPSVGYDIDRNLTMLLCFAKNECGSSHCWCAKVSRSGSVGACLFLQDFASNTSALILHPLKSLPQQSVARRSVRCIDPPTKRMAAAAGWRRQLSSPIGGAAPIVREQGGVAGLQRPGSPAGVSNSSHLYRSAAAAPAVGG